MHSITALPLTLAALLLQQTMAMPTFVEDMTDRLGLHSRAEFKILAPIVVGIYVCTEPNWKGTCVDLKNGPGICSKWMPYHLNCSPPTHTDTTAVNFNETFSGNVSSVGPDSEVSGCTLFQ